jgi:uncharacterized lipoprotein NlpE involved in copper resistance
MKTAIAKILTVAAATVALAGCVSESKFNEHVASADAAIKAAQQDAAAARAAADAATAAAKAATDAAAAASNTANQAGSAAKAAQACCDANSEKIDRAFQKSMGK